VGAGEAVEGVDLRGVGACADDVLETRAGVLERRRDDLEAAARWP
jgi:hypothetical protein